MVVARGLVQRHLEESLQIRRACLSTLPFSQSFLLSPFCSAIHDDEDSVHSQPCVSGCLQRPRIDISLTEWVQMQKPHACCRNSTTTSSLHISSPFTHTRTHACTHTSSYQTDANLAFPCPAPFSLDIDEISRFEISLGLPRSGYCANDRAGHPV